MRRSTNDGDDPVAIDVYMPFKDAADNAFLSPDLALAELAVLEKARKLCTRARAARAPVVFESRAEHKVSAVCIQRRREKLDVVYHGAVFAGHIVGAESCPNIDRIFGELFEISEVDRQPVVADEKEPIAAPGDIAYDAAAAGHVDLDRLCKAIARNVSYRDRSVIVKRGLDRADRCFDLVFTGRDAAHILQSLDEADRTVPAHSEVSDIIEIDDAGSRGLIYRFAQKRPNDGIVTSWFANDGRTKPVIFTAKYLEPLTHQAVAEIRKAADDNSRRLAARVRIDRFDPLSVAHLFVRVVSKYNIDEVTAVSTVDMLEFETPLCAVMKKVMALVGSLSARSSNLAIVEHVSEMAAGAMDVRIFDGVRHLPQFNPDLDKGAVPSAVADLRSAIADADMILISTPEYVFGVPGALKNALDWTVSSADLRGKPAAVIVAALSGEKAFESILKTLETLEARIDEGCRLLIPHIKAKLGPDGIIKHESIRSELERFVASMASSFEL